MSATTSALKRKKKTFLFLSFFILVRLLCRHVLQVARSRRAKKQKNIYRRSVLYMAKEEEEELKKEMMGRYSSYSSDLREPRI
jgi:hypothetical protein